MCEFYIILGYPVCVCAIYIIMGYPVCVMCDFIEYFYLNTIVMVQF